MSGILLFEGFRFDRGTGELFRLDQHDAGVPVEIGTRASALLGLLVERPGKLVAKDEIIEAVWRGRIVEEANLTVQIAALRRILDGGRKKDSLIQTVPRRGYRFIAPVRQLDATAALDAAAPAADMSGQPTGTIAFATPQGSAERRQLTVMSCDLVVATRPAGSLDPEDLREIVAAYYRAVAEVVTRFEGFVARCVGDGVVVYFGYPKAHEDDAERAVRAGLGAIDAAARLDVKSVELHAHVGIATGLVVVSDLTGGGSARGQSVIGEAPNLAARLQAVAEPDAVVIAADTRRLVGDLFEYRDLGTVAAKGMGAPVPAWQVLRPSGVASRFEALRGPALSPLIGREEEVELLLRRWTRAKAGDGQIVLISGEAGLGKSRLAAALGERLHAEVHLRLGYFCSPHHQDSALFPFIDQLGRASGFARNDPPATRLEKLEALLARAAARDEDVALLSDLLSLPGSERLPLPNLSPQKKKERTLEALIRQIEGLARRQPILIVLEDAHWIDPTSRELLDLAVERVPTLPMLLVVTFRPEFQPPWIGHPRVTMLTLNRLDRHDQSVLVKQIAGGKALPEKIIAQIVDRTDGVPLFVEELTKSILESGLLREEQDYYILRGATSSLTIPTTLHASLLARLDRLASARHVAGIGAAIGREFSYALLRAVSRQTDDELRASLARLVAAELVSQRGVPPDAVYSFKHALVQDAAYGSLLRKARQQLHAHIAEALEADFPELADTQPELLAQHYAEAGLSEKSVAYWGRAGQRSAARSAMAEAVVHLRRGLEILDRLPHTSQRDRDELGLQIALGRVLAAANGFASPEVGETWARACALCRELGDRSTLIWATWSLSRHHHVRGRPRLAREIAEELRRLIEQEPDSPLLPLAHAGLGPKLHSLGEFALANEHFKRGIAVHDPEPHRPLASYGSSEDLRLYCLRQGAWTSWALGYADQALAAGRAALDLARESGHAPTVTEALAYLARLHQFRREPEQTRQHAEAAMQLAGEHGFAQRLAAVTILSGWARAAQGTPEGIASMARGVEAFRATGAADDLPYWLAILAGRKAALQQFEAAWRDLDEATALASGSGILAWEAELHRLKGELLTRWDPARNSARASSAPADDAEGAFAAALAVSRRQQAKFFELRAAINLARLRHNQARRAEARDLLAPVYGWFTEGFATPDLREAKALLDELT